MFNVLSPYGKVTKYEVPDLKGFFLKPASDTAPDGWTAKKKEGGGLELPGDPGGGEPYRFVGRSSGEPRTIHSPGDFFYGEIDWVGKLKDESKPEKGKVRLSYHGPNSRYFGSDKFAYGSAAQHNNIYMEGRCIAVAPYPVLGAAIRVVEEELTPEEVSAGKTPAKILKLISICLDGEEEKVYTRTIAGFGSGVTRKNYGDEFRAAQMEPYDPDTNPTGWELIGSHTLKEADQHSGAELNAPRVPWFFNASATQAVSVRECTVDITIQTIETKQSGYNKFILDVASNLKQSSYTDAKNTPGFQVHIETLTENAPDWVNFTPWPLRSSEVLEHRWKVVKIHQLMTMKGEYIVASDYVDDTMVDLKYVTDHYRSHFAFYYFGVDNLEEFDAAGHLARCNFGDVFGDWVYYEDNLPSGAEIEEPFGITTAPIKRSDQGYLLFPSGRKHWISRHLTGSKSEFDTGVKEDDDTWLYFFFSLSTTVHFADIRQEHMLVLGEEQVYSGYGDLDTNIYETEQYDNGKQDDYVAISEKKAPAYVTPGQYIRWPMYVGVWADSKNGAYGNFVRNYKDTRDYVVIDGLWFMEYLSNMSLWGETTPNPVQYYEYSEVLKLDSNMYSIFDSLQSTAKAYRPLGAGVDDFGTRAVSMEYTDAENKVKYFNYMDGASMSGLTHAEGENQRFFPIGVS